MMTTAKMAPVWMAMSNTLAFSSSKPSKAPVKGGAANENEKGSDKPKTKTTRAKTARKKPAAKKSAGKRKAA